MYRIGIVQGNTTDIGPTEFRDLATAIERAEECARIAWADVLVIRWEGMKTVRRIKQPKLEWA